MVDLKKKYKKAFDAKFAGKTVTSNIVDTSAQVNNSNNINYFNRKETFKKNEFKIKVKNIYKNNVYIFLFL